MLDGMGAVSANLSKQYWGEGKVCSILLILRGKGQSVKDKKT
jgi:hypothetical protein